MTHLDLDRLVFVPAGRPWQKAGYAESEDRFLMAVAAAGADERFAVSRIELDRPGDTYSVDTLELCRDFYGSGVEIYLVIGADAALALHTWHRADDISRLARIAVVGRGKTDPALVKDANPGVPLVIIDVPEVGVSATDIRRRAARGDVDEALVPPAVARYIRQRGLYSGSTEK